MIFSSQINRGAPGAGLAAIYVSACVRYGPLLAQDRTLQSLQNNSDQTVDETFSNI